MPEFDTETNNGANMALYNKLLEAAVDSIARTFQKRVAAGLQSGRSSKIPDQAASRLHQPMDCAMKKPTGLHCPAG